MKDSRDFARLPLSRLIARCALPAMISMSAMALYSVIDGVFVGYFLGAASLAAVNLVFPLFLLFSAVIDMIAAGSSVQIATRLGAGLRRSFHFRSSRSSSCPSPSPPSYSSARGRSSRSWARNPSSSSRP